jgi:uncharacterized membrane protein YhaH (DUF805 family)
MAAPSPTSQATNPEPRFFLPRGRIGVRSMLVRSLACYLPLVFLGFLLRAISIEAGHTLSAVVTYPLVGFMIIMGIKRAHDMEYSGWAVIILGAVPCLLLLPGTNGPNRFGPPPTRWF